VGILGMVWLATNIMNKAPENKEYETATLLLNSFLPLIGTWIGTVIAFYFGTQQVTMLNSQIENANAVNKEKDQTIQNLTEQINQIVSRIAK